jgi:hypothetical protein
VVHHLEQDVVLRTEAQHGDAQQRPQRQIERTLVLLPGGAPQLRLPQRLRQGGEVDHRQGEDRFGRDLLDRPPPFRGEGGAQRIVAAEDLAEGELEHAGIEPAGEADGRDQVVGRGAAVELLEEPHPFLAEGERRAAGRRAARDRGRGPGDVFHLVAARLPGGPRQPRHGRVLEEPLERHLGAEGIAQSRQHLGGQQGVAAEVEEVVVDAHALEAEQLLPDLGDGALGIVARRGVAGAQLGPGVAGAGQRRAHRALAHPEVQPGVEVAGGDHHLPVAEGHDPPQGLDAFLGGHGELAHAGLEGAVQLQRLGRPLVPVGADPGRAAAPAAVAGEGVGVQVGGGSAHRPWTLGANCSSQAARPISVRGR